MGWIAEDGGRTWKEEEKKMADVNVNGLTSEGTKELAKKIARDAMEGEKNQRMAMMATQVNPFTYAFNATEPTLGVATDQANSGQFVSVTATNPGNVYRVNWKTGETWEVGGSAEHREEIKSLKPLIDGATKVIAGDTKKAKKIGTLAEKLRTLGLTKKADELEKVNDMILRKAEIALYGDEYKMISGKQLCDFDTLLRRPTNDNGDHSKLVFHSLSEYNGIPPTPVLEKLGKAKERGLFKEFAVIGAFKVDDPILVGLLGVPSPPSYFNLSVNTSSTHYEDCFFVAEWGSDVSLEEILSGKPKAKNKK